MGASAWPFAAAVQEPCETAAHEETLRRLEQCIAVHSSGVLHGPNGVGKSRLVQSLVERLPQKTYRTVVLSLLLAHRHRRDPLPVPSARTELWRQRRSDNLMALRTMWGQRDGLWPVWIFEEAQNLTTMGLEELRLLSCERLDTQSPFSLLLVGDATLMPRLHMGVNRPLLGASGLLSALGALDEGGGRRRMSSVVWRRSDCMRTSSIPRRRNCSCASPAAFPARSTTLGQRAFEEAARERSRTIRREHIQKALDQLPWLGRLREEE